MGEIELKKWAHKHISLAFSMRDILKEESLQKSVDDLDITDFQKWFVKLQWEKGRGTDGIDENGNPLPRIYLEKLFGAMHKTKYMCFKTAD